MELLTNILALTNSELALESVTIAGIKLGHHKNSIPTEIITEESGRGWLQTNQDIVIRTSIEAPEIVVEFLLRSSILLPLKISKKKNIEKKFGKASAVEQRNGSTYYFYENRKMIINWDNSDNQLYGIYLGDNIIQQTQFTIKDFLTKYYEFKAMVPDSRNWKLKSLRYNEPRFYRLKALKAMLAAFDIGDDLEQDFLLLGFLNRRTVEDFAPIIDDIEEYVHDSEFEKERWAREKDRLNHIAPFRMLIQNFFRFSAEAREFLQFNNSWLEAGSVLSRYAIYTTQKFLNSVDIEMLHKIESLLCKLIDPEQRTFTKSYLINHYNYPDVDLDTIDLENY